MTAPEIVLVVARAQNGVIGKDGALPWHIPADLKHFKQVTTGTPMIMGRKTFESLPSSSPGRRHIVLTRDRAWAADGAETRSHRAGSAGRSGLGSGDGDRRRRNLRVVRRIATAVELTEIFADAEGDTVMPPFQPTNWREVSREQHAAADGRPPFSFVRLVRASR
jgi:dihydrofolate reductase